MPRRAYRPEVSDCLEGRALLSAGAGHPAAPFVFPLRRFELVTQRIRQGFFLFGRYHDVFQLRSGIEDFTVLVPYGKVDGLQYKIDRIIDRMAIEYAAHVPNAVRTAQNDVLAVTRAAVFARVQAGDVVLR